MRHLTHGIVQDPMCPDRYYFSPARVSVVLQSVLSDPLVPDCDRTAVVLGRLLEQALTAETQSTYGGTR